MLIDTHCHLNMMVAKQPDEALVPEHLPDIDSVVAAARLVGIGAIVNVGTSVVESQNSCLLARRYEDVFATVGVHPCDVSPSWQQDLAALKILLEDKQRNKIVGIGETGLDYYHKPYDTERQAAAFRAQIELALAHDLPLVVHIREAGDDALKIIAEYRHSARGVIHCFSLDLAAAQEVIGWGWYIGIDGPVTYKKNDYLRQIVATVPLSGLLLETDAPFLTPQAMRGKQNSPIYLSYIANEIAAARGCTVAEVAAATTANAQRLFNIV